ncbi:MAG: uridine phosphorylase [Candidatus Thorarchaeota archaeon]|nr:MAG: uridine phosphorylase [Candidatus Thorarchaeota archaeon]
MHPSDCLGRHAAKSFLSDPVTPTRVGDLMAQEREYHISIAPGEMPPSVLLPGDPDRARLIAERFFKKPVEVAHKREYWSFRGEYEGAPVGVCSTGIGCPSAAIALEELVRVGCNTFVRVGTAGAIDPSLNAGDLVIFTGVVRDDGTSRQYVPIEFPAVADPGLVMALSESAGRRGARYRTGIGHTKDAFYSEYPGLVADPNRMKDRWNTLRRANVIATEMESAALFIIGQLRGVRVGSICVIVGESIDKESRIIEKPRIDELTCIALDALSKLGSVAK